MNRKKLKRLLFASTLLPLAAATLWAEAVPTKVLVRAVARDAKVIGSGVGGARITVTDASTGQVLAQGVQTGGTGDTRAIMVEPHPRDGNVYGSGGAASFTATLELERPTVVEISAEAPLGIPDHTYKTAKTMLLIPGQDVLGEGVVLEIHGLNVHLLQPQGETVSVGSEMEVRVNVVMV